MGWQLQTPVECSSLSSLIWMSSINFNDVDWCRRSESELLCPRIMKQRSSFSFSEMGKQRRTVFMRNSEPFSKTALGFIKASGCLSLQHPQQIKKVHQLIPSLNNHLDNSDRIQRRTLNSLRLCPRSTAGILFISLLTPGLAAHSCLPLELGCLRCQWSARTYVCPWRLCRND